MDHDRASIDVTHTPNDARASPRAWFTFHLNSILSRVAVGIALYFLPVLSHGKYQTLKRGYNQIISFVIVLFTIVLIESYNRRKERQRLSK